MPYGESIRIRKSAERGSANHGWLKTKYSFSFADYHDPRFMGFRTLRVINEDFIAAGRGFPTHPHRDMEIFSYILEGQLEHKDSMGNGAIIRPGQIQLMSAGKLVTHSEKNPGDTETHMLQIWIQPREKGLTPGYTEWQPKPDQESDPKVLIISPDGRDGSAIIHQDANIYRLQLSAQSQVTHDLTEDRGLWLQVLRGSVTLNDITLEAGDAASTEASGSYLIDSKDGGEALLFDLL